jgi:hypothetical protein
MSTDPAIEAVRAARIEISREVGNDPARLIEHYAELQKKVRGKRSHPETPFSAILEIEAARCPSWSWSWSWS